tara:strand:+ start:23 stop:595 length:573 start_codon:yes stop_codon:yes gene_type:complete
MATLFVDKVDPQSGTSLEIGSSGDTITIPAGATITNNGTQTGFGGANTPAFSAERDGGQSITNATRTTVLFNNEFYDSSSAYDTSTGKFTPQTAGKYFVTGNVILNSAQDSNYSWGFAELYKNSSVITESVFDDRSGGDARRRTANPTAIVDMNGSSDFLLIQVYIAAQNNGSLVQVADISTFQAFKIIE